MVTNEVKIEDFDADTVLLLLQYMYGCLEDLPSDHSQVIQKALRLFLCPVYHPRYGLDLRIRFCRVPHASEPDDVMHPQQAASSCILASFWWDLCVFARLESAKLNTRSCLALVFGRAPELVFWACQIVELFKASDKYHVDGLVKECIEIFRKITRAEDVASLLEVLLGSPHLQLALAPLLPT